MRHRIARSAAWSLCAAVTTVAAIATWEAFAQQPQAPRPGTPRPAAPKPPAAAPQQQPAQQPAPPPGAQAPAQQMPNLVYSPWTKLCGKGQEANAKQVCFTGKDAFLEVGVAVVAVVLIEPEGDPNKILRVTVPSPLQLKYGARIVIDQQQPLGSPFFTCFTNGCMADFEANADLLGKLKSGQMLNVQAIHLNGTQMGLPLPLADFAKANAGPPTDPKVFEEQQKKRQEEMAKKAEELRKKMEQQQAQQPQPPK